jgi:dipeptidyl aminopeptidase/acylaminoacyl peptidase
MLSVHLKTHSLSSYICQAVYEARSPLGAVDRIDKPLALFQGLEDKIVPPNQVHEFFFCVVRFLLSLKS